MYYSKQDKCRELYEANVQKKKKGDQTGKQHNAQGAQYLGLENVKQRRKYAKRKHKKLEDKQDARRLKHKEAKTAKAYKELMRLRLDLLGLPSKQPAPAVPSPKPAHKPQKILANA